ncbi:21468_t:CDS:2, partial [Racocetra persica]
SPDDDLVDEDESNDPETIDLTNAVEMDVCTGPDGYQVFVAGWCLKKKQKKRLVKRLTPQVRSLLETIFYTGTASPRNKITATEMQQELLKCSQKGEISGADIPELTTISNWI